jgi:ABC-2 type transport system permease protein
MVRIQTETAAGEDQAGFDWLSFSAPSMAILFLMFTVTAGGSRILAEQKAGTLPRLLVTPTSASQVLGGKVLGIYTSGLFQMSALFLATFLILGVSWGEPLLVTVLVLVLVLAATSWGILIAAVARTTGQANVMGTAISLVFAIAAGNFIPRQTLPEWLQFASKITPNAWGLDGLEIIQRGGGWAELAPILVGMLVMAAVLFTISVFSFRRRFRMVSAKPVARPAAAGGGA